MSNNCRSEADFLELGKFYFLNNKYDEAAEQFKKALEINPKNAQTYYNLGLVEESVNKIDSAKEMYQKAILYNPDYEIAKERLEKLIGIE